MIWFWSRRSHFFCDRLILKIKITFIFKCCGGAGGHCPPDFRFCPPRFISCPPRYFFGRKKLLFLAGKKFKFLISARKSLRIPAKTFFFFLRSPAFVRKERLKISARKAFFFGDHLMFAKTSPQSNSGIMKIWVKFNAGFQLCPPDFNFAPPRSRKAGDAPGRVSIAEARLCDILKLFHGYDTEWSLNWRKESTFAMVQTGQVRTNTSVPNLLTWGEN